LIGGNHCLYSIGDTRGKQLTAATNKESAS
jgi:hypothetical protein